MYLGCFCPKTNLYVEKRRFSLIQFAIKGKKTELGEKLAFLFYDNFRKEYFL